MQSKVGFLSGSFGRALTLSAILLASASLAMADIPAGGVFTSIWTDWEAAAQESSVTFTVTGEFSTDLGIDDYVNNFCFGSESCFDQVWDIDSGDQPLLSPFPGVGGTITIPPDTQFFCNGTVVESGCNGSGASDIVTVDFSTPWVSAYAGETFVCGGTAFVKCGFAVNSTTNPTELLIRFDGPTVVPEPGSWVLLLSAAAALLVRAGRLRKRSC
jgi:hypothetical protein